MAVHAILLAGGAGDRFGGESPKQFIRLAGETILVRSLRTVAAVGVDSMVVVAHPEWLAETEAAAESSGVPGPIRIVAGGRTRNESTWAPSAPSARMTTTSSWSTTPSGHCSRST